MIKKQKFPYLRQVILRLILFRLFLPLLLLELIVIAGIGYFGKRNLQIQQYQAALSMSHVVDYYLDYGGRILDAVAKAAENSDIDELSTFMESTWDAYGYFDTLYYLSKDNKIKLLTPYDPRYSDLDMSNLPDFQHTKEKKNLIISRPFVSLRTGEPTVYLIKSLLRGGCIVGELNLGLFQQEITKMRSIPGKDLIFIMDQSGTLLAHPNSKLVKQQTNISSLEIFHLSSAGETNAVYRYNGITVLGSAVCIERTGWIVVDQVPLSVYFNTYVWTIGLIFLISLIIWLTLVWNLRKQLHRYVITPMEKLSLWTNALIIGDFNQINSLASIPTSFAELNTLTTDFLFMSNSLQVREAALRESEDRYRSLFDTVPIGIFRFTIEGEISDINPAVVHILGYPSREALLTVSVNDLLYISSANQREEKFIFKNEWKLNNFEKQVRRYDGTIIWIRINIHLVHDPKEEKQYYEGSMEDITERKLTENKIKQQQELLFKAEKKQREALEKALVMKDEFISLISHEFKTPLNVIYSAIQLIDYVYLNQIPDRVKELIGTIKLNTFRQLRLANNLLDITRLNSGQYKLNMKNIDIVFLTKVITESVELYANQKNIKLSFKSNVTSKNLCIDDEKYERIILNILSNAIKFTENGGRISVTLNEIEISNMIQVKVKDTGIGIPKDKQELIFERFGQVDSNLSRRAEGTGIGLSLVKLLVDILGGSIEVESKINVGSTFTISLPIKEEESECESRSDTDNRLVSEIEIQFSDIYF